MIPACVSFPQCFMLNFEFSTNGCGIPGEITIWVKMGKH